jgi:hypothetical protein
MQFNEAKKVCQCPANQFISGQTCEDCGANCAQCSSGNFCTVCEPPFTLNFDGLCYSQNGKTEEKTVKCPKGTIFNKSDYTCKNEGFSCDGGSYLLKDATAASENC